jgi:hypothetical protein
MASFFGFEFKRKRDEDKDYNQSFAPLIEDDGAMMVAAGGVYGTYVDLEGSARTEAELVTKYREMAQHPEMDSAIDDIVNESIVQNNIEDMIKLNLDQLEVTDNLKKLILDEFDYVLDLVEINTHAYDVFRRWYIDGRLYYHVIIDDKKPQNGIKECRYIDPRKIRKVKEVKKKPINAPGQQSIVVTEKQNEYFIYNDRGFAQNIATNAGMQTNSTGVKINKDSIIHVTSGITDKNNTTVLSHLHKAIKPLNQLRTIEDATLIYRISRAPERRIFYIDVGNLPKMKAEQYLRDIMQRFKNRVVYDSATGEVRDDRKFMTMLEDFWFPRREGGKGTEVQTLPAGQNLGEMEDVKYFQRNLYKALNIPVNRIEPEQTYNLGRATEISRDEIKFMKFVTRLQTRFSEVFMGALEKQLILKKIITPEDWVKYSNRIRIDYAEDNYYSSLKQLEVFNDRIALLNQTDALVGKYVSKQWVKKNILQQTAEEIEAEEVQIASELESGQVIDPTLQQQISIQQQQMAMEQQQQQPEQRSDEDKEADKLKKEETISDEEKKLVESMTKFMESMTDEE